MTKIYRLELYSIEHDDIYQDAKHFAKKVEDRLSGLASTKVVKQEASEEFEWDDDLAVNNIDVTDKDFEEYFSKSKPLKLKAISFDGGDDGMALVDAVSDKAIMFGDEYHDKIDDKIAGFLEALKFLNVEYECEESTEEGYVHESKYNR